MSWRPGVSRSASAGKRVRSVPRDLALVMGAGEPKPAGLFRGGGMTVFRLDRTMPEGTFAGVTVEREGGAKAPTGSPILRSPAKPVPDRRYTWALPCCVGRTAPSGGRPGVAASASSACSSS
jgi:hypothetical protein